jgi:predicted dehydrogenase
MIRFGIVGIGGFATTWRQSLTKLEERGIARLSAAVVRSPERYANEIASLSQRDCQIYPDLETMLREADGHIDIVGVPTGISQHVPMSIQALEAGYPVLVEKPLAATVQEVVTLQEAETRTGHWCAVGYQWIHSPTIQWLASRIRMGALGTISEARSMIGWPRTDSYYSRNAWAGRLRDDEGHWVLDGPATNATAHYLMNLLYLVSIQDDSRSKGVIAEVQAELYRARDITGYDTSAIRVTTCGGARLLHVTSHALERSLEPVMMIVGSKGTAQWEAQTDEATIMYHNGREERFRNPDVSHNHARPIEQAAHVVAGIETAPLCDTVQAGQHVATINLAFESSGEITRLPQEVIRQRPGPDGTALACVQGMSDALQAAYDKGLLFSQLGLDWARATEPVSAAGYHHFPTVALAAVIDGTS